MKKPIEEMKNTPPVLWADEYDDFIDKSKPSRDCECVSCGPSAAVYAKVADDSWYDWRCASCGYTPESVDSTGDR